MCYVCAWRPFSHSCLYICDPVPAPKPTVRFIKFGIGVLLFNYKTVKGKCFSGLFSNTFLLPKVHNTEL